MSTRKSAYHRFLVVSFETLMSLCFLMPRYSFCNVIKAWLLRCRGARIGKRVIFYPGVWVMSGRNLVVGDDVDLSLGVLIGSDGGVTIGDRALIGFRTQLISDNHVIPSGRGRIFDAGCSGKPITIGSDVWIGANCVVLAGVTIGEGSVIGAGSVVSKPIPACVVAVGCPAKVIRDRS